MIDWILTPRSKAQRPAQTRLLFAKVGIPILPAEALESPLARAGRAAEHNAFFWMMAAVTCKYINRPEDSKVQWFLDVLKETQNEMQRLLAGDAWDGKYNPGIYLALSRADQAATLRQLCTRMENLAGQASHMDADVPTSPQPETNILLDLY